MSPTSIPAMRPVPAVPGRVPMAFALLVAVVAIQIAVGAYQSERGLHTDEAAHFMNGLLLRDYLREGLGQNPMAFAQTYYDHFPKIAPLMWPPLFHGVLGIALLPGWPPMAVALFLLAICTAWTAWRLYTIVNTFASLPVALGAVFLFLVTPAVVSLTSSVMVDIVIAAIALESAYWLGRYVVDIRLRDAAWFGLFAALGCLAKGNGVAIVLMPFAFMLLARRVDLLWRPGLYLSAAIVLVLAVPLLALSFRNDAALGDFGPISLDLMRTRIAYYAQHVWLQLGPWPLAFAGLGAVIAVSGARWTHGARALAQARMLVALALVVFGFHIISPHVLSSTRYMAPAFAPLLGLTALGVFGLCGIVNHSPVRWSLQLALFLAMASAHFTERPVLAAQPPLGYRAAIETLATRGLFTGARMLVVSNEQGEGACVAEVAVRAPRPWPTVVRGSKFLASDDWMGRNLRLRFATLDAMSAALEQKGVDIVILDASPEAKRLPYWSQVHDLMADTEGPFRLLEAAIKIDPLTGPLRPLLIYVRAAPTDVTKRSALAGN